MIAEAMDELALLFKDANADLDERQTILLAISADEDLETLADLDPESEAAQVWVRLRERAAEANEEAELDDEPVPVYALAELYGLEPPPLLAAAYGIDPHDGCDLSVFCRNPLHPGPCKGWKDTLRKVAPGVFDAMERDRKERAANRKGQGKGRDGDGDGIKGEGKYEKKGRKPRKKTEPPEPDPSDGHPVKLRKETRALVAAATKLLPKTDEGWKAVGTEDGPPERPIDKMVDAEQQRWFRATLDQYEAERLHFEGLLGKGKTAADAPPDVLASWRRSSIYQRLESRTLSAKQSYESMRDHRDKIDKDIAAKGGVGPDGRLPAPYGHLTDSYTPKPTKVSRYQTDPNGVKTPPEDLVKMHAAVQAAGDAIRQDLAASFPNDPDWKRINDELSEANRKSLNGLTATERNDARLARRAKLVELRRREKEMVHDALAQLRPMGSPGGRAHKSAIPLKSRYELSGLNLGTKESELKLARKDWEAQLGAAEEVFPTDWNVRSGASPLTIISTARAFHSTRNDWRTGDPNRQGTTLAMNTDKGAQGVSYDGAFNSYVEEVTAHEMGHRMEAQIPGLKALEFAYVRSKTTKGGVVEPQVKLKDLYGGGYRDTEVTYKDEFANAYTGKTYENASGDPLNEPWEAFQVGLQQTFGRGSYKYGDESLEAFTLGVLATLGRS